MLYFIKRTETTLTDVPFFYSDKRKTNREEILVVRDLNINNHSEEQATLGNNKHIFGIKLFLNTMFTVFTSLGRK